MGLSMAFHRYYHTTSRISHSLRIYIICQSTFQHKPEVILWNASLTAFRNPLQ